MQLKRQLLERIHEFHGGSSSIEHLHVLYELLQFMEQADSETNQRAEAFIREILRSPEDPTPIFVFADWLEEEGDPRADRLRGFYQR